ncbi:MAG: type II methionyl aminopeptidase [Methanotrichaceae archaeon]|nr:type II methionyl aminopeptidase [Methanotrichaceae archaeon]
MDSLILENYRKAGTILASVLAEMAPKIEVGASLLEVAEAAEEAIRARGGEPAFPCNISLDRAAAHYTPGPEDPSIFGENMVKLDIGVHVDGYIADAAVTVDLSGHPEMVEASREALDAAIELVRPGTNTSDLGAAIERAITGYGFRPVYNLTGHGLERYQAHAEPSIPNRAMEKGVVLKAGDVFAIEPFATNGQGRISEAPITEIFGFSGRRPVRNPAARALLKEVSELYKTLPFARRWLKGERVDFALNQLLRSGAIHRYPVLWEGEGMLVSQAEHTVIVTEDGCEVTTRPRDQA